MSDPVSSHTRDGVVTVRLERPEAMNALDTATKIALLACLQAAADSAEARCVVLTGSGRAFCVGQDLREHDALLTQDPAQVWRTVREHYNPIVHLLSTMDKPVVAAVNGVAAGAGAAFAFAADLRYVADTAAFDLAFAGVGLSCDSGTSWSLPRLVGGARAKELLLLPRTVSAAEAAAMGLVTELVAADRLEERVREVACRLAEGPTLAYGAMRRAISYSAGHPLQESLDHEAELMDRTGASTDHAGAVRAFLAKQTPKFTGR